MTVSPAAFRSTVSTLDDLASNLVEVDGRLVDLGGEGGIGGGISLSQQQYLFPATTPAAFYNASDDGADHADAVSMSLSLALSNSLTLLLAVRPLLPGRRLR